MQIIVSNENLSRRQKRRNTTENSQWWQTNLLFTVFSCRFGFVEALQRAVHPLVESPMSVDWNPMRIQRLLDVEKGLDGALQNGSERDVEPGRDSETKYVKESWQDENRRLQLH